MQMAVDVNQRKYTSLLIIAVVALLVQFVCLAEASKDPTLAFPLSDAGVYHEAAQRYAAGGPLTEGAFFQPPLFQVVLGLLYRVAGANVFAARLMLVVIATGCCVLMGVLTRRAFGARAGLLGGIMLALYGPFLFFSGQLLPTSLAVLLNLGGLCLLLEASTRRRWHWWLLSGLTIGLATITVPNAFVLLPIGLGMLLLSRLAASVAQASRGLQPPRTLRLVRLAGTFALLCGTAIPIACVTYCNYHQSGEFVLIANNGGVNLYLGNNPDAERTVTIRPGHEWYQFYRRSVAGGARTPAERNSYFFRQAWDYVRDEPGDFLAGLARKAVRFVNARELPRTFDIYVYRDFSMLLRLLTWRVGSFAFPFGVLGALALLGMVPALKQREPDSPQVRPARFALLAFVLLYSASVVLFFVSARHRLPVAVLLIPFAAHALVWLWGLFTETSDSTPVAAAESSRPHGRWRSGLGAAAVLSVGAVFVNLPLSFPTDKLNFRAELYHELAHAVADAGELETATQLAQHALELAPDYAAGYAGLGLLRARQGAVEEAEALFRQALKLNADAAEVYWYLGNALHLQGKTAEALEALNESLTLDPYAPEAHAVLADVLVGEGRTQEAVEHYRRALELPPPRPELLFDLARALALLERYGESISCYRRGLAEAGPQPRAVLRFARLLLDCPQPELRSAKEAAVLAEHLVTLTEQREPRALELLADAYAALNRRAEATRLLEQALARAQARGDQALTETLTSLLQRHQPAVP